MWIDPLVKWQPEQTGDGREALLAGRLDDAERHFSAGTGAHDLIGLGDVLMLQGRDNEAIAKFERAAELATSVFVECGLSQSLILQGDAGPAAQRLEPLLAQHPGDPVIRHHLSAALLSAADQARSVTRNEKFVITSQTQVDICAAVVQRVAEVAADDQHVAAARQLWTEIQQGQRWVWSSEGAALGLSLLVAAVGVVLVAVGGGNGNIALVVLAAVLGAAALYGIVLAYRRQAWQVHAARIAGLVWRRGQA